MGCSFAVGACRTLLPCGKVACCEAAEGCEAPLPAAAWVWGLLVCVGFCGWAAVHCEGQQAKAQGGLG